jgi:hypothetical protein
VSQKLVIPKIEDIVWGELLAEPTVRRRSRNGTVLDQFAVQGWIKHSSRKNEFEITKTGRGIAQKRLTNHWPSWQTDLLLFKAAQLSPEDPADWSLLKRDQAGHLARKLNQINRRTLFAWERRHSKAKGEFVSAAFDEVTVTTDEIVRLRLPPCSRLKLKNGRSIECDELMETLGEVDIPERGWENIERIEAPQSRAIFSIENKGAFVDFPLVATATLVFVPGDDVSSLRQVVSKCAKQPLVHFGDLDPKGIQIYRTLAQEMSIMHFIPNYVAEYIDTHRQECDTPWPVCGYESLNPVIGKLASIGQWLEQEALVLDHRFQNDVEQLIQRLSSNDQQA